MAGRLQGVEGMVWEGRKEAGEGDKVIRRGGKWEGGEGKMKIRRKMGGGYEKGGEGEGRRKGSGKTGTEVEYHVRVLPTCEFCDSVFATYS